MLSIVPRNWLIYIGAIAIFLVIAAAAGLALFFSPLLTHCVAGDAFRQTLENETAKGLHFPRGRYSAIRRTGPWTAQSEGFLASDGEKAMKSIAARGITAKFNPWAVFVRRWELDEVHVQSGDVEVQIYEHKPELVLSTPWFSIFLPNRVVLKRIESEASNVTWQLRGERAGFFGTHLLVTPNGPDFEYRADGGMLKMTLVPDLYLRRAHLLITKTLLTIYDVDLAPDGQGNGTLRGEGRAGIGEDKSVNFSASFDRLPIGAWLPSIWKGHFTGYAAGTVHWTGKNPQLESSSGEGSMRIRDAKIDNLSFLEKLAAIAQKKSLAHLQLNDCSLDWEWRYPKIDVKNIAVEEKGKFRIQGVISIDGDSLGGSIQLGVTREYLEWLPNPEEIFTREQHGYFWTTVHLSGTVHAPQQDLSPRVVDLFKESPSAFLGLFLRELGAWLKNIFLEGRATASP